MTSEVAHLKKHVFDACMNEVMSISRRMSQMPKRNFQEICIDRSLVHTEWRSFDLKILSIQCDIELGQATEYELKNEEHLQEIYRQCYGEALEASNYHLPPDRSIELECRERMLKGEQKYTSCKKKMNQTLLLEAVKKEVYEPCMKNMTALTIRWKKPPIFVNGVCMTQAFIKSELFYFDLKILTVECDIELGKATNEDLEREKKLYQTRWQCFREARKFSSPLVGLPIRSVEMNCREAMMGAGKGVEYVVKNPACLKKDELTVKMDIMKKEILEKCEKELKVQAIRWKTPTASIPEKCEQQSSMKTERLTFDIKISTVECDIELGRKTKHEAERELKILEINKHCWDEAYNMSNYRLPLNRAAELKCRENMISEIEHANEAGYSSCEEKKDKTAQLEIVKKNIQDECIREKTLMFTRWRIPTTNMPEKCEKSTSSKIEWRESEIKTLSMKCDIEQGKATKEVLEEDREKLISEESAKQEKEQAEKHPACAKKSQIMSEIEAMKREIIKNCTLKQKINSIRWKTPSLFVDEQCQKQSLLKTERRSFDVEISRIDCDIELGEGSKQELEKEKKVMQVYKKCWDEAFVASSWLMPPNRAVELKCRKKMLKEIGVESELEDDEEDDVSCSKKSRDILQQREEQKKTYETCMTSHSFVTSANCLEQNFETTKLLYTKYRNIALECEGSEAEAEIDAISKEVLLKAYDFYWMCANNGEKLVFAEKSEKNAEIALNECADEAAEQAGL